MELSFMLTWATCFPEEINKQNKLVDTRTGEVGGFAPLDLVCVLW